MNDKNSPFEAICNELAREFDEADLEKDIEKTKNLITGAKTILTDHDEPAYAPLFYSVGTSLTIVRDALIREKSAITDTKGKSICPYTDSDVIKIHSEALWYFRHAEDLLEQIEENALTKPYLDGIRMVLFVNLGNALDFCGRKCSAIDYYSKAMNICPFGMAFGNIARCMEHYATLEDDPNHRAVLYKTAYAYYLRAEQATDVYTYPEAKEEFVSRRKQMEACFGKAVLESPTEFINVVAESEEERKYREWCLSNHLFLNTLNDLQDFNQAFASDPLHISSITTPIAQTEPPFVFEMFDQVKEGFIYARYMLFEVMNSIYDVHYADKGTHLDDVLNYSSYSIRLEKLKTAYRTVYSLLDKIAFLLNAYLNLGIRERDVNFDGVWRKLREKEKQNIAIGALHWINRDFKDKFGEADTPYTNKLKDLRHALEHKFLSVHIFPVENEIKIGDDFIYRVSEDHLMQYTMDLLKIVREAIIELTIAIRIEEYQRNDNKGIAARLSVYEYLDDFKR